MAQTYLIESADDDVPIDPALLRELRDLLRGDDDLDLGLRLKDRPPAPGQQGALPVALEIVSTVTPLATAFAGVVIAWINAHKVRIKVHHGGQTVEFSTGNSKDMERLIALVEGANGANPGDRD
jgi:hypothetical protein